MKKKRMVELEEDQELDEETFEELYTHARNSGIWYATNLPKTTKELKKKLYEKGYPKGPVVVVRDNGVRERINIVDTAVQSLVEALFVDDLLIAERFAENKKNARWGRSKVAFELQMRGIEAEDLEDVLDAVYETDDGELRDLLTRKYNLEAPRAQDPWKLRRKLAQHAVSKGWDFGDVQAIVEELMEQFEQD